MKMLCDSYAGNLILPEMINVFYFISIMQITKAGQSEKMHFQNNKLQTQKHCSGPKKLLVNKRHQLTLLDR